MIFINNLLGYRLFRKIYTIKEYLEKYKQIYIMNRFLRNNFLNVNRMLRTNKSGLIDKEMKTTQLDRGDIGVYGVCLLIRSYTHETYTV